MDVLRAFAPESYIGECTLTTTKAHDFSGNCWIAENEAEGQTRDGCAAMIPCMHKPAATT